MNFVHHLVFLFLVSFNLILPSIFASGIKTSNTRVVHAPEEDDDIHGSAIAETGSSVYGNVAATKRKTSQPYEYSSASTGSKIHSQNFFDPSPNPWKEYTAPSSPLHPSLKYIPEPIQIPAVYRKQRYAYPEILSDLQPAGSYPSYATVEPYGAHQATNIYGHSSGNHGSHGHSSSHDSGYEYGGQGQGHHHKHIVTKTNYKVSAVNTDAIGLLGLLGLLGILQSVLLLLTTTTTTTTTTMAGRRKRDASFEEDKDIVIDRKEFLDGVSKKVLPSLNVIAQARIRKIPFNCAYTETCRANYILVKSMGGLGKIASYRITNAIKDMLQKVDSSPRAVESISKAGEKGRFAESEGDCEAAFPVCKDLAIDGVYALPLLLPVSHPFYYDHHKARMVKK